MHNHHPSPDMQTGTERIFLNLSAGVLIGSLTLCGAIAMAAGTDVAIKISAFDVVAEVGGIDFSADGKFLAIDYSGTAGTDIWDLEKKLELKVRRAIHGTDRRMSVRGSALPDHRGAGHGACVLVSDVPNNRRREWDRQCAFQHGGADCRRRAQGVQVHRR
jgi:hypothetical protein